MILVNTAFAIDLSTLPKAPDGYVWQDLAETGGAIRRPKWWSFREFSATGGIGYVMADGDTTVRERYVPEDYPTSFEIRFMVFDKESHAVPSNVARRFYQDRQEHGVVHDLVLSTSGGFSVMTFYSEEPVSEGAGFVMYYYTSRIMYNDKGRLFIIIAFKCRKSEWDDKKQYAEVMLSDMHLYDFSEKVRPNQALLPTPTAVTPPAAQVSRQP